MKKYCPVLLAACSALFFFSCEKEYSCEDCNIQTQPQPQPLPVPAGDSVLYYQFSIDNKNYKAIAFENNFIVGTTILYGSPAHIDSGAIVGSSLLPPNTGTGPIAAFTFAVARGIIKNYSTASANDFRNFFSTGSYGYSLLKEVTPPYTPVKQNGIAVTWGDENGNIWRSDNGSGNQTGSRFTITRRQDIMYNWGLGIARQRVTAEFNFKIYNDQGAMKEIKNGRIAYYFAKDF